MIDLDALEKLAAQATPGPWEADMLYNIVDKHGILVHTVEEFGHTTKPSKDNVRFIVAACNSLPDLIAENRALRVRVQELEQQREFFLRALNNNRLCPNGGCFHDGSDLDEWDCTSFDNRECWIQAAKEAE